MEATFPALAQTLVRALGDARYPQLVLVICGGLKVLATDVYERANGELAGASEEQDAEVLSQASTKLLPSLFKLVETLHGTSTKVKLEDVAKTMEIEEENSSGEKKNVFQDSQRSQIATEAIAALARLSPEAYLQSLFKKVMQRLLAASQSDEKQTEQICTLLGLSQALVTSQALDDASISLLYRVVKPFIRTDEHEARVQKRAYKVLLEICQCHPSFVTEPARLAELTALLLDSIMTSQVSARHMRLKCMTLIVEGFDCGNPEHSVSINYVPNCTDYGCFHSMPFSHALCILDSSRRPSSPKSFLRSWSVSRIRTGRQGSQRISCLSRRRLSKKTMQQGYFLLYWQRWAPKRRI